MTSSPKVYQFAQDFDIKTILRFLYQQKPLNSPDVLAMASHICGGDLVVAKSRKQTKAPHETFVPPSLNIFILKDVIEKLATDKKRPLPLLGFGIKKRMTEAEFEAWHKNQLHLFDADPITGLQTVKVNRSPFMEMIRLHAHLEQNKAYTDAFDALKNSGPDFNSSSGGTDLEGITISFAAAKIETFGKGTDFDTFVTKLKEIIEKDPAYQGLYVEVEAPYVRPLIKIVSTRTGIPLEPEEPKFRININIKRSADNPALVN